ncbi:uncharacterized protein LOC130091301 [Rhinichthys klamathensis goyatoka]|uniref:uncharacterized protein LOC130091301 n=1 Tax=Rhinichthys klamathensis goyatoka TaxID=3034132 RepID=UPI0024B5E4FC|nr:uncharacterized protein LOC130091301 [Rhinichthys klamathensis goyatoka]
MTSEPEADVSDVAAQSASDSGDAGALLEVTFQRNPSQKYKYLEAEPKILGVTEIALNVFFMGLGIPLAMSFEYSHPYAKIISFELMIYTIIRAFSVVVGIIAGSVAIAAQKLHLPTLKACLGMQVITCVAYTCFFFNTMNSSTPGHCWLYNETITGNSTCSLLEEAFIQLTLLDLLMEATQIAISLTLAAYCCKVIACCTPRSHVPVIVMMRPTAPQ